MRFKFKNKETTSFKKRYKQNSSLTPLRFGSTALILLKSSYIEHNYIAYFKKVLKIFFKFKKTKLKKVWIFLNKNFPITTKSKNSRMGKGKGKIIRYCMRVASNYTLFELSGFSKNHILKIKTVFSKRFITPINIFTSFNPKFEQKLFRISIFNFRVYYRNL